MLLVEIFVSFLIKSILKSQFIFKRKHQMLNNHFKKNMVEKFWRFSTGESLGYQLFTITRKHE